MINKNTIYLCVPVNFLLVLPNLLWLMFSIKTLGINFKLLEYVYIAYCLLIFVVYSLISYKKYPKVSGGTFFKLNMLNLLISLLINQIPNKFLEHWYWLFYALTSNQHLIANWLILLIWQCLVRFFAWIVHTPN